MHLKTVALTVAGATGAMAASLPTAPAGLKVFSVTEVEIDAPAADVAALSSSASEDTVPLDGILTWYTSDDDDESTPAESLDISKRCGSNQIECHTSNMALELTCGWLIDEVRNNPGTMPTSPRSTCLTVRLYGTCCISWSKNAPGAAKSNFLNAATKTLDTCGDGYVSGKSKDTNIGGVCLTQCLSNRPDGCV